MNKYVIIAAVAGIFVAVKVRDEYISIKDSLAESRQKVHDALKVSEEAQKTLAKVNQTIDELRKKIFRLECAASQAVEPIAKDDGPKIVMHSNPNCVKCQEWKRVNMPAWVAQGWAIEVDNSPSTKPLPWFEICEGGKCYVVNGLLTLESYTKAKGQ